MAINKKSAKQMRHRGIYLLPNLFTTAGLFAGFYAIVAAMKGLYDTAAIAIFIAMIADALDGRVARFTQTQTAFGGEYDSLSDMVAFGVAPALVTYSWVLYSFGKIGWLIAFIYTAATALRLARFNTQISKADKRYFQGLPSPTAAAIMAGLVWVGSDIQLALAPRILIGLLTLFVAALMVSNIRYYSFKDFDIKNRVPFVALLVLVLVFACIAIAPAQVLFLLAFAYGLSGPLLTLISLRRARLARKKSALDKKA